METDFAAGFGRLVDGIDDLHEIAPLFRGSQRALALSEAADEMVQLLLVRLLVEVLRRLQRRRHVEQFSVELLVDAKRVQERRPVRTEEIQVGEILLEEESPADLERKRRPSFQDQ